MIHGATIRRERPYRNPAESVTIQTSQIQAGIACERLRLTLTASVANPHLAQAVGELARVVEADVCRRRRDLGEHRVGDRLAPGGELDRLDVALGYPLEVVLAADVLARGRAQRRTSRRARREQL